MCDSRASLGDSDAVKHSPSPFGFFVAILRAKLAKGRIRPFSADNIHNTVVVE